VTSELATLRQLHATPALLTAVASTTGSELAVQRTLRSTWDADLVRAALSLHEARERAGGILPNTEQLWLTGTALEQCTHPIVAEHKAARYPTGISVLDLCCGLGSDAAALARRGPVTVLDHDEAMLQRCVWNMETWGCPASQTMLADAAGVSLTGQLIHADPDRRSGRSRPVKRLEQYVPDLKWMQHATRRAAGGGIKIGSASNFMQKFPGCEIELISLHGECREATVWFGQLAATEQFRATVLPSGETIAGDPLGAWANVATAPGQFLLDPDPAVVRSGMLDGVCERLHLDRLDAEEEYLTSDTLPGSSFVTAFEVIAVLPNNQKRLRQYLRSEPGQYYEIKCRRISVNAAEIAGKLPRGGAHPKVVFFLSVQGKTRIIVAKRL
jgi:hypothetical protein